MQNLDLIVVLFGALLSMITPGTYGTIRVHPRIIGGREVQNRCQAPFNSMVPLQFQSSSGPVNFCSTVMVNERFLVTVGICVENLQLLDSNQIWAIIGERDMSMVDTEEEKFQVESYKVHPGFNNKTLDNNIAMFRLSRPARFSSCVKPANKMQPDPMACRDMDSSCIMAGWGQYAESSIPTNSRLPRSAGVTLYGDIVSNMLSTVEYKRQTPIGSLFAEPIIQNVKTCFFDWGGVVSCLRNGIYVLSGLIGQHTCNSDVNLPITVTDVTYFQSWIDKCINDWPNC